MNKTHIKQAIGDICSEFKRRRLELGMTQREVANMCGITRESYNYIEHNRQNLTISTFVKIAIALSMNIKLVKR